MPTMILFAAGASLAAAILYRRARVSLAIAGVALAVVGATLTVLV